MKCGSRGGFDVEKQSEKSGIIIIILSLAVLLFIIIFGIGPLVFSNSITLQRLLIFPRGEDPKNPQYSEPAVYGTRRTRNFYISVRDVHSLQNISLGVWQILPEAEDEKVEGRSMNYEEIDFDVELLNSRAPILIYFHGNSGTRIKPNNYARYRRHFHVIAFDYRGFGDSSEAIMSEEGVVDDSLQMLEWVRGRTRQSQIYVWGHSLGTGIATHAVKRWWLERNMTPVGLILEAPFSKIREEVPESPAGKVFAWLPYFNSTILDPLDANEFHFWTTTHIADVHCPIMVLHAADDRTIPQFLGERVVSAARTLRNEAVQGNVTYHDIDAKYKCGHSGIYSHPDLDDWIVNFKDVASAHQELKSI